MWTDLAVRRKGAVVVIIPSICLLITLAAWVWSQQVLESIHNRIDYSETIVQTSDRLLMTLLTAETSVQGYLLTADAAFLAPYNQVQNSLNSELAQFEQLLQGDRDRLADFQAIEAALINRMDVLKTTLAQSDTDTQGSTARLMPLLYQGKTAMDNLRERVAAFQQQELQILNEYDRQRQAGTGLTTLVLWFAIVISLMSLAVTIWLFSNLDQTLQNRNSLLQESQELLQGLISHVVDGVVTLDPQGKIETFNLSAATMFGLEVTDVVGQGLEVLLEQPAPRSSLSMDDDSAALVEPAAKWQTQGYRGMAKTFPVEVSMSDTLLDDRRIVIIRDITEFQQTEAKLQARADELARLTTILAQTNATLENRNRELEQFAYVASHDLKAPLRAIANLSEWLEEDLAGQLPEENEHQMQLLRGRVSRMEALINGLLEYSRVGRTQTAAELVAVSDLLTEVVDSLDPPATFTIDIAPDLPTLQTKRVLLRQVFANLITNAIKHHDRDDGYIQISARDRQTHYEFAVADDGPGIAAEYHSKIFAIFQTLEARDTKESTGIGLSLVKKIVESEGGTVDLESAAGQGAIFRFTWPKQTISA